VSSSPSDKSGRRRQLIATKMGNELAKRCESRKAFQNILEITAAGQLAEQFIKRPRAESMNLADEISLSIAIKFDIARHRATV
jgi:hypothetical protein